MQHLYNRHDIETSRSLSLYTLLY